MRTKTEQGGNDGPIRPRAERPVRYRIVVVIASFMIAAGLIGVAVFALTMLGSLMR